MPFDILGYQRKFKDYYGDAPLADIAKDAYKIGGYDNDQPDFNAWVKTAGIEPHLQEDYHRRNQPKEEADGLGESLLKIPKSFLKGGAEGLTTELPSMIGGALQFAGSHTPFKGIEDTGKSIKDWAEEKRKDLYGPEIERTGLDRIVYEGTKMLAPSLIPGGILGTAARGVKGVSALYKAGKMAEATAAAKSATNFAGGTVAALFGLSQAQQTKDTAVSAGVEPGAAPYLTGAIEAAGEFFGTKYLAKLFRLDEAEVAKRGTKELAKDLLKTLGVEVGTEIGQAAGESGVEKYFGVRPNAKPIEEAIGVIGPTIFMTLLTAGIAGGANKLRETDPESANYLEKLKMGAMASMSIKEGLEAGQIDGEPFTPENAVEIVRDGHIAGIFDSDDLDRFKQRYPQIRDGINDIISQDVIAKVNEVAAPVSKPVPPEDDVPDSIGVPPPDSWSGTLTVPFERPEMDLSGMTQAIERGRASSRGEIVPPGGTSGAVGEIQAEPNIAGSRVLPDFRGNDDQWGAIVDDVVAHVEEMKKRPDLQSWEEDTIRSIENEIYSPTPLAMDALSSAAGDFLVRNGYKNDSGLEPAELSERLRQAIAKREAGPAPPAPSETTETAPGGPAELEAGGASTQTEAERRTERWTNDYGKTWHDGFKVGDTLSNDAESAVNIISWEDESPEVREMDEDDTDIIITSIMGKNDVTVKRVPKIQEEAPRKTPEEMMAIIRKVTSSDPDVVARAAPASGGTGEQPSTRTAVMDISPKAPAPEGGGLPAKEPWQMTPNEFSKQRTGNPHFDEEITGGDGVYLSRTQATHKSIVEQAIKDGKPVPPEVLKDYPELAKPIEQPKVPEATVAKQPHEMTRSEYRHFENAPKVQAIQGAIRQGKKIAVTTHLRSTLIAKPEHIRITSDGTAQIPSGRKWVALTDDSLNQVAAQAGMKIPSLQERVYHRALVEKAMKEGINVPPEVLKEYPELKKKTRASKPKSAPKTHGAIGRIIALGGVKLTGDYSKKDLRQFPDFRRTGVLTDNGMGADDMAAILRDENYTGFNSGDELIEGIKDGRARQWFNPESADEHINKIIEEKQNAEIEHALADLKSEGIDAGRIEASSETVGADLYRQAEAEGDIASEEAAVAELDTFLDDVVRPRTSTELTNLFTGELNTWRAGEGNPTDQWEFHVDGIFYGGSKDVAAIYGKAEPQKVTVKNPLVILADEVPFFTPIDGLPYTTDLSTVNLPDGSTVSMGEVGEYAKKNGYDAIVEITPDAVDGGSAFEKANIFVITEESLLEKSRQTPNAKNAETLPGFDSLPQATKDKFNAAFESKDIPKMQEYLDLGNKNLRAEFENRAGVKLPNTVKGTDQAVSDYFAAEQQPEAKQPWQMTREEYIAQRMEELRDSKMYYSAPRSYQQKLEASEANKYSEEWEDSNEKAAIEGKPVGRKPLWMMTSAEFERITGNDKEEHGLSVKQAIADGLPVPANVLAEYPDLQPKEEGKADHPITQQLLSIKGKLLTITSRDEAATIDKSVSREIYDEIKKYDSSLAYNLMKKAESGLSAALFLNKGGKTDKANLYRQQVEDLNEALGRAIDLMRKEYPVKTNTEDAGNLDDFGQKIGGAAPANEPYTLENHKNIVKSIIDGTATPGEFKSAFALLQSSKDVIAAELTKLTKPEILKRMGGMRAYRYKNEKKDVIVKAAISDMEGHFILGRDFTYQPFGNSEDNHDNTLKRMVNETTEQDIKNYAARFNQPAAPEAARGASKVISISLPMSKNDLGYYLSSGDTNAMFTLRKRSIAPSFTFSGLAGTSVKTQPMPTDSFITNLSTEKDVAEQKAKEWISLNEPNENMFRLFTGEVEEDLREIDRSAPAQKPLDADNDALSDVVPPLEEMTAPQVLAKHGLAVDEKTSQKGKKYWAISGNTKQYQKILDDLGFARPFRMGGTWYRSVFDADPTDKVANALLGNIEVNVIETLERSEAEFYIKDKAGITLVFENGRWYARGKTYDYRQALNEAGGVWTGDKATGYAFTEDPTERLGAAIKAFIQRGVNGEGVSADSGDVASETENQRLRELREREDGRVDERIAPESVDRYISPESKRLLRQGLKHGVPEAIVEEQIEDVAAINSAFQNNKPMYMLANGAGTGKTFVLGAAIKELTDAGAGRVVYVTQSRDLISQIKNDLSSYGVSRVEFHTYAEMSTKGSAIDARDAVLVLDEGHNTKNVSGDSARGLSGQRLMAAAKFTIFSSATPYQNPVEAQYLAGTGIFDSAGGFNDWAKVYGAAVRKVWNPDTGKKDLEMIYWPGRGKKKDGAAARQWMFKQGVMSNRPMKIDAGMVDTQFRRQAVDQMYVDIYDKVQAAYDAVLNQWTDDNGNPRDAKITAEISRHRENTVKRVLEAAKTGAAIKRAKDLLDEGKNVVVFVETKSERYLGRWRKSEYMKDDRLYIYDEVKDIMHEWEREVEAARMMNEKPPSRPFAPFIVEIASTFDEFGIDYPLPSVSDEIQAALKDYGVSIYTGDVSQQQASRNKADFLSGGNKVLVATMAKGGTGLSLHDVVGDRPTVQLNINLPWAAWQVDQVAARVARYGLKSKAVIEWMFASNIPWESTKLAPRVGGRMSDMGAIVGGIEVRAAEKLLGDFDFEGVYDVKQAVGEGIIDLEGTEGGGDYGTDEYSIADRLERTRSKASDTSGGFFATPFPLSVLMKRISGVKDGESLLEPSAGGGNLLKFVPDGVNITAVERRPDNIDALEKLYGKKPNTTIVKGDFLEHGKGNKYDVVLMNPPFERVEGIGAQDIAHVQKAFSHLKEGGRLVAIMGEGAFFRNMNQDAAFRGWLDEVGATVVKLPEGAFKKSGTMVRTRMVVIDKDNSDFRTDIDLQDMTPDNMKDVEAQIPARVSDEGVQMYMPAELGQEPTRNPQERALIDAVDQMRQAEKKAGYSLNSVAYAYEKATGRMFPYRFILPTLNKLGVTVSFDAAKIENRGGAAAVYDVRTNQIIFNDVTLKYSLDPIAKFEEVISHEGIHAVVINLRKTNEAAYNELNARLLGFVEDLEPHVSGADYFVQAAYRQITEKNLYDEITNLAFTNPKFAAWLNSIPATEGAKKSQTLWGKLKEIILKAIGSVTGATRTKLDELNQIMDSVMGIGETGTGSGNSGLSQAEMVAAWHGGGELEGGKFDPAYIGSAQGTAVGWGFYFSDLEEVGRYYADLARGDNQYTSNLGNDTEKIPRWSLNQFGDPKVEGWTEEKAEKVRNRLINEYNGIITEEERKLNPPSNQPWLTEDRIRGLQEIVDLLNKLDVSTLQKLPRNLYKVSLHKGKEPGEYTWLDWDKPVSKKNEEKILSQLEKEGIDVSYRLKEIITQKPVPEKEYAEIYNLPVGSAQYDTYRKTFSPPGKTGQEIYGALSYAIAESLNKKAGSDMFRTDDRDVSSFLLRAGIDGNRVPVGYFGGTAEAEGKYNYVVFDPNAITVENHIQYSRKGKLDTADMFAPEDEQSDLFSYEDRLKQARESLRLTPAQEAAQKEEKRKSDQGEMKFQKGEAPARGLTADKVQSTVDKAVSGLRNPPKINVVSETSELPEDVLSHMEDNGILDENGDSDVVGFSWNGEVWIVANNHDSAQEVVETVAHELTHNGLGTFFANQKGSPALASVRLQYETLMNAVYRAHRAEVDKIAKTTHTHLDIKTVAGCRAAAEEWLCNQTYEAQPKWYDKMVAIFNDLLRAIGIDAKLTDAEVRVVLQDAFREFGKTGGRGLTGEPTSGSRYAMTSKPGTANIPPETTPKAVGGIEENALILREREKFKSLAYNPVRESSGGLTVDQINKAGGKILNREEIPQGRGVGFGGQREVIEKIDYTDAEGRNKIAYIRYEFDGQDGLYESSIISGTGKEIPSDYINAFFQKASEEGTALVKDIGKFNAEDKTHPAYWVKILGEKRDTVNKSLMKEYGGDFDKASSDSRWIGDSGVVYKYAQMLAEGKQLPPEAMKDYFDLLPNPSRPPEVGGRVQYSTRSQQDPPTSKDPKVLNLYLKDETDAIVQTFLNKLHPKSMNWMETMLKSPEWFSHPQVKRIVKLFMRDRSEIYHETFNDLNATDHPFQGFDTISEAAKALKNKGLTLTERAQGKVSKEYEQLQKILDEGDTTWKRNTSKTLEEQIRDYEDHIRKQGATEDTIAVWKFFRQSFDKALDLQTAQLREMIGQITEEANFLGEKPDTDELKQTLKGALAMMEEWKGFYAPRMREQGDWKVQAVKQYGPMSTQKEFYREHAGSEHAARRIANRLQREGWKITNVGLVEKVPEDIYQDVHAVATAKLIDAALEKMSEKGNESITAKFNEEILRAVADEIKARGFRSHMIHRKSGSVTRGYIEDPLKRLLLYTNQISGGISKARVARMAMEALLGEKIMGKQVGGIDPVSDPKAYAVATNYIREQLRNLDASDRAIGLAKSIATFKFLGFNLRSLAVNMTAIATTAPAAIHQYTMGGKGSIAGIMREIGFAGKDYGAWMAGKKFLNADEQNFMDEVKKKGWDDAQYTREAMGEMSKIHSKVWSTIMDGSMYLFGKSEQWNRGTTMLAAYRIGRKMGMDHTTAAERAKDASDKAHGVYGRATMPMWAQGENPAAKIGQMAYVYGKFSHNYLQMLYDMGIKKHNIKGAMFAFLSPLVLAGGAALPFKDAIFGLAGMILSALGIDRDPEKWVWDIIREHLGKGAEKIGRHGLTGAAGLDISGSLSIGVGIPKDFVDLTGAIGGVAMEGKEAFENLKRGQFGRAAEHLLPSGFANPLRAIREAGEGATTRNNRRVWDEGGKPFVPSAGETAARAFGFRSTNQAVLSERTWEGHRQQADFAEKRNSIYERYRAWTLGGRDGDEYRRIVKEVQAYNDQIGNLQIKGVSRITRRSLKDQARRMRRPSKNERALLED